MKGLTWNYIFMATVTKKEHLLSERLINLK